MCDQQSKQKLIMHAILGQSILTQQRLPADGLAQEARNPRCHLPLLRVCFSAGPPGGSIG